MSIAIAAALVLGAPAVASAETIDPAEPYGGVPPQEPTLAGSSASPTCADDVPLIRYRVVLTDPDAQSTSTTASLVLSSGANSVTLPLGDVSGGVLEGSILWPGASVTDGVASGWPGWEFTNGEWRETTGNFAWTRGAISATINVNPSIDVALSYPPASSHCVDPPNEQPAAVHSASALPATGGDTSAALGLGIAGGSLLAAGGALVAVRRRRRS